MPEKSAEKEFAELSSKIHWLVIGYKMGVTGLLGLLSLMDLGAALSIGYFRQLFRDALGPDHPFPQLTIWVLAGQDLLPFLAMFWLIIGLLVVWVYKNLPIGIITAFFLCGILLTQLLLTWLGLFLPMVTLVNGMADSPR